MCSKLQTQTIPWYSGYLAAGQHLPGGNAAPICHASRRRGPLQCVKREISPLASSIVIFEATNTLWLVPQTHTQKLVFCGFHFSQTEANILPYHTTALTKEAYQMRRKHIFLVSCQRSRLMNIWRLSPRPKEDSFRPKTFSLQRQKTIRSTKCTVAAEL